MKENKKHQLSLFGILLSIFCSGGAMSFAQTISDIPRYEAVTEPNTEVHYLQSKYTGVLYRIYVDVPANYSAYPYRSYPAIFLLDADYSFPIAKAIVEHLSDRGRMPETFIFGIAYADPTQYELNRTRDYTPWHVAIGGYSAAIQKLAGGAENFSAFIQNELLPNLNKSFRLNSDSTLVGHSYGGLFASWLMLKNPRLFNKYIIVSPSLWYDDHELYQVEKKYSQRHQKLPVKIFFGIGAKENNGTYRMVEDLNYYSNTLRKRNYTSIQIQTITFPFEDHDTIFPTALTQGLLAQSKRI